MSFGSAKPKPAAAPAQPEDPTAKPSLLTDIKQDGFFTGIADYVQDHLGSHKDQVSMVEQHKIEAANKAAEEEVIRQEIADNVHNEETLAKPGIMEDIRHDGFFGGVGDWAKDHLPGHSDAPAAMYHQEFGEAPPPEAMEALDRVIMQEYVPSNVRPRAPLTAGNCISETKVTKESLASQGRFFELPPQRIPPVAEPSAIPGMGARAVVSAAPLAAPVIQQAPRMVAAPTMMAPTTTMMTPATTFPATTIPATTIPATTIAPMAMGARTVTMAPTMASTTMLSPSPVMMGGPVMMSGSPMVVGGAPTMARVIG